MNREYLILKASCLLIFCTSNSLAFAAGQTGKQGAKASPKPAHGSHAIPPAGNMGKMFGGAMELYNAGKYQDALVAFDRILKRYPGLEPNKKMIARTLYKLERFPEAWTFFAKIPPNQLEPDAAYEYGFVAFNARQYELCLTAMKRVPDGHGLHDLANYYGGLSALKLKRFPESEAMFEQAQVLPDRLARSRMLYLKHVQQLQTLQEQSQLNREREAEKTRIMRNAGGPNLPPGSRTQVNTQQPPPPAQAQSPGTSPASSASSATPAPYEHKGFTGVSKMVTIKGEQRDQLSDNHGFNSSTAQVSIGSFKFQQGAFLPFGGGSEPVKDGGKNIRKNAFSLQLLFGGEDRLIRGKERRIVIVEDDQDLVRILQTDPVKKHRQFAYVGVDPSLEFALPGDWWLQTGASGYFEYPDFKRLGRTGVVKGIAGIGTKRGKSTFQLSGSSGVLLDTKNKTTTETKDGTARFSQELNSSAGLEVEAVIKDFRYKDESLDGPDQSLSVSGLFSYQLGFGLSANIFGAYERQKNSIFHNMPTYNSLSADGDVLTYEANLSARLAGWLGFSATQTVSKTTWNIHQDFAEEIFKTNVPDYLSLFKANVAIYFPF